MHILTFPPIMTVRGTNSMPGFALSPVNYTINNTRLRA